MNQRQDIQKRIEYFFEGYRGSIALAESLLTQKFSGSLQSFQLPHLVVLLTCSVLDSLSNLLLSQEVSQAKSFTKLVEKYSFFGKKFCQVSVPNLYMDLITVAESLAANIPKEGRLCSQARYDKPFVEFIMRSELPVSIPPVRSFFQEVGKILAHYYCVSLDDKTLKCKVSTVPEVVSLLRNLLTKAEHKKEIDRFESVVREYTFEKLLYREYRCKAVHAFFQPLNEEVFYNAINPTFVSVKNYYIESLSLLYPGKFLVSLARQICNQVESQLKRTKKLPWEVFNEICPVIVETDLDLLDFLDEESIPEARKVVMKWGK